MWKLFCDYWTGNLKQLINILRSLKDKVDTMKNRWVMVSREMEIQISKQNKMLEIEKTNRNEDCF